MMQYTLIKIPVKEVLEQTFDITISKETEIERGYRITQSPSLLFDQIERIRGTQVSHLREIILVVAKKNPKQEAALRKLLTDGFYYNGVHYRRFGKSASQAKEGITAFVCDEIYEELYAVTQMDIPVQSCIISKYEAQRCLLFSSCTPICDYMPNIVIIGKYEKTLRSQWIKYVSETQKEFTDPDSGETKPYTSREVKEGFRDLTISPFDGCGCHERDFMETVSAQLCYNTYIRFLTVHRW